MPFWADANGISKNRAMVLKKHVMENHTCLPERANLRMPRPQDNEKRDKAHTWWADMDWRPPRKPVSRPCNAMFQNTWTRVQWVNSVVHQTFDQHPELLKIINYDWLVGPLAVSWMKASNDGTHWDAGSQRNSGMWAVPQSV